MTETLLLTRREIMSVLAPQSALTAVRDGFVAMAGADATFGTRFPVPLPPPAGPSSSAMLLAPGYVPGIPAYSVKMHAKFPGNDPALQGLILLHDLESGNLLAVLESTWLTALRTGVSGALGADCLARPDATVAAIIGAGAQGRTQLECLRWVRDLTAVRVFDTDPARAEAFAAEQARATGLPVTVCDSVAGALNGADIVVAVTWATEPFITAGMVAPGMHISTLGPDQPGKAEVSAEVIRSSWFVVDDRDLAVAMGAAGGVGLGAETIDTTLAEVLAGQVPGRTGAEQCTVYGAVGLPFQDLVVAWAAYRAAQARGLGRTVRFLD